MYKCVQHGLSNGRLDTAREGALDGGPNVGFKWAFWSSL